MKGKGFHVDVVQEHLEKEAEVGSHLALLLWREVKFALNWVLQEETSLDNEKQIEIKPTKDR